MGVWSVVIAAVPDFDADSVASHAFGSNVELSLCIGLSVVLVDAVAVGPFGGGFHMAMLGWAWGMS